MSKKKKSGQKKAPNHKIVPQPAPQLKSDGAVKRLKGLIGTLITVLGLASVYFEVRPNVSISPYASLDDASLFSQQIRVTNEGNLPIHVHSVK